ncbi:MAG: DNA methyltransferase, partial [Candidatus Omnitrophica bacterium]|nr:DNA methyltransferase [Candidatus Omnitrophota bacterium]
MNKEVFYSQTKERKFFKALEDVFVGAKVEGESGFINLMQIKQSYYEKNVFPHLKKDIDTALEDFPEFREELFEKLYTFFESYFSESGSIYFRYTPIHKNIYEKVYTDDKDVMLFYKTHMLYYVKTDRLFKNLEVKIDNFKFFFDVSGLEHKRANEKRQIIYEFKEKRKDNTLVFLVFCSEKGRATKTEEILKKLKKENIEITEDTLEKAFKTFEKQSEVDYFINKNAKEFLKEQFDLWFYQYVFLGETKWQEKRINQLKTLREIAFKIIDFISQFEDELVKIWNKPKFVLNSNYVITLDRIALKDKSLKLIEKIIKHQNFSEQIKEWQSLSIVEDDFKKSQIIQEDLTGKHLNKKYKFLPIDTKYFKDLELEILGLFEDLDNSLDGWLIKSENYQALNTILPKFKEKVQTIYIDPPFNREQDADYLYNVKYKDATWATILENRLRLARDLLNDRGSIFVRCDYNGNWIVRPLMDEVLGRENFRNEIIVKRGAPKSAMFEQFSGIRSLGIMYDNLFWYSSKSQVRYTGFKIFTEKKGGYWSNFYDMKPSGERPTMRYEIFGLLPQKNYYWKWSKERGLKAIENYKKYLDISEKTKETIEEYSLRTGIKDFVKLENGTVKYWVHERYEDFLDNNWLDISGYSSVWSFKTENSEILLKRVIESTTNTPSASVDPPLQKGDRDIVLD